MIYTYILPKKLDQLYTCNYFYENLIYDFKGKNVALKPCNP